MPAACRTTAVRRDRVVLSRPNLAGVAVGACARTAEATHLPQRFPPRHGALAYVAVVGRMTYPQATAAAILYALLAYEQLRPTTPRL